MSAAWAEAYHLFNEDGQPSRYYAKILAHLKTDDTLEFADGSVFVVERSLNHGNSGNLEGATTQVIAVHERGVAHSGEAPIVLRVPLYSDEGTRELIDETGKGFAELKAAGVPAAELKRYVSGQYAVVERVEVELTFMEFLRRSPTLSREGNQVTRAFIDFVHQTAHLDAIGDFHPGQLVYVKKRGWIVLDWTTGTSHLSAPSVGATIDDVFRNFGSHIADEKDVSILLPAWQKLIKGIRAEVQTGRCDLRNKLPQL